MPADLVEIKDVFQVGSTETHAKYRLSDGSLKRIPWSMIDEGSVDTDGQRGDIYIQRWYAETFCLMKYAE